MAEDTRIYSAYVGDVGVADTCGGDLDVEFVFGWFSGEDVLEAPVGVCVGYDGFCWDGVFVHC